MVGRAAIGRPWVLLEILSGIGKLPSFDKINTYEKYALIKQHYDEILSHYGIELGVTYPDVNVDDLLASMTTACDAWRKASVEKRVGCALEILDRLNKKSFDMAFAVMHTTGQGFMMAFQAGGPHAQDRGLEAVAYAYKAMLDCPSEVTWKKQVGKDEFVTLNKKFASKLQKYNFVFRYHK